MNPPARTFILVAITVAALLLMHQLPTLSIGGTQLREVNILSQVVPENDGKQVDVLPTTPPHPIMVQTQKGAALHKGCGTHLRLFERSGWRNGSLLQSANQG